MAEEQCVVEIKFCDDSTEREVYDDTRYGKIQARDRYWTLVHEAKGNSHILNQRPPHMIWLKLTMPKLTEDDEHTVEESFTCPCADKGVLVNG